MFLRIIACFQVSHFNELTDKISMIVRSNYLGFTRSISWLRMSWLLVSPGHQQPWYWISRIGRSLFLGRISTTCVISLWRNGIKCKYMADIGRQVVIIGSFNQSTRQGSIIAVVRKKEKTSKHAETQIRLVEILIYLFSGWSDYIVSSRKHKRLRVYNVPDVVIDRYKHVNESLWDMFNLPLLIWHIQGDYVLWDVTNCPSSTSSC